eukprot:c23243_g3_i1 orf=213-1166(-)
MEGVNHRTISTNGITMHFAEMGSGPVMLFLHGFPEGWYGWRKQISVFARAGYHAIAPDMRGYGDTSAPEGVENYSYLHIVGDLIGLLDVLQVQKAFVVGHDWGSTIGWQLSLFRPDRVIAFASLSVPFKPRKPSGSLVQLLRTAYGEDEHYILKFQAPGEVEAQIASISSEVFFRHMPRMFGRGVINQRMDFLKGSKEKVPLPKWMSKEELAYYITEFEKKGFTPPLNYYRAWDLSWILTAAWTDSKVMVPTIFMIGDQDLVYDFPGTKTYIHEGMEVDVPLLKVIVLEGTQHFLQLEKSEMVNDNILAFFKGINDA